MKKIIVIAWSSALLLVVLIFAYGKFKPTLKAARALRTPTAAQISAALPGDAREIFEHSEKFVLFSLDPLSLPNPNEPKKSEFYRYYILGQTQISDPETLTKIRRAYYDGLVDTSGAAACFSPRHGIRAMKNGETLDLVICFHCHFVEVHLNDKNLGFKKVSAEPQDVFNEILTAANVDLPAN